MLVDSQPEERDAYHTGLQAVLSCITSKLLKDNFDNMTSSMFKHVPLNKECPNEDKETL
jgi:hypothetical protein